MSVIGGPLISSHLPDCSVENDKLSSFNVQDNVAYAAGSLIRFSNRPTTSSKKVSAPCLTKVLFVHLLIESLCVDGGILERQRPGAIATSLY